MGNGVKHCPTHVKNENSLIFVRGPDWNPSEFILVFQDAGPGWAIPMLSASELQQKVCATIEENTDVGLPFRHHCPSQAKTSPLRAYQVTWRPGTPSARRGTGVLSHGECCFKFKDEHNLDEETFRRKNAPSLAGTPSSHVIWLRRQNTHA